MRTKLYSFLKNSYKYSFVIIIGMFISSVINAQSITPGDNLFSISEPDDVEFYIQWDGASVINSLYFYYYDEFDDYHEELLNLTTDYSVDGNTLIILQTYIESLSPESGEHINFYANFDVGGNPHFGIFIIPTIHSSIVEDNLVYDLSNPSDMFSTITWALSDNITQVEVDGNPIDESNYYIMGDFLFFTNDYLSSELTYIGAEINVIVTFNSEDTDTFIVETVLTGNTNPELSQTEYDINENEMPEYIETIITWNDATSVTSMNVTFSQMNGYPQTVPYEDYTITPINSETATLKIILGNDAKSTKEIDYFYVAIEVIYNINCSNHIFLGIYSEYYDVNIYSTPEYGGYYSGNGEYDVDEDVIIEAYSNPDFIFEKWIVDETTEITQNPYSFVMPANDVSIEAIFVSEYPTVITSNPVYNQIGVDPAISSIQITFDREIMEGTTYNGFDDISFDESGVGAWTITDIYIESGNILIIVPNSPLNINTTYYLNIPNESIEDLNNPGTYMNNPFQLEFTTGFGDYITGEISPEENYYSIMEPTDVEFDINWGDETSIENLVYFYYDEFDDYQEIELINVTDFEINGNSLTIKQSFINSLSPEVSDELMFYAHFNSDWNSFFNIMVIETSIPSLLPNSVSYDLSNPDDVFTHIIYNMAESISSVSYNSTPLVEDTDYYIDGMWLFIDETFLDQELNLVDDVIVLDVEFNTEDNVTLTITAIQTNVTSATIDPNNVLLDVNSMPEYVETTITWNDASEVESLTVWSLEEDGMQQYDYTDYVVTPINTLTATLRVYLDSGAKNKMKSVEKYYATIQVNFDIGNPAFYYLTMTEEQYEISISISPLLSGIVNGDGTYYVDEVVSLSAGPNIGYVFQNWRIDELVISSDNPYIFNMPANDLNITAYFIPEVVTMYTLSLNVEPITGGTVLGAGDFAEAENVTINAIPQTGFVFANWTDDLDNVVSTEAEYNFSMPNENLTLTANFNDNSNVPQNSINDICVYPNPFSEYIIISNFESIEKISILNITGQIIEEYKSINSNMINTSDFAKGLYLIQIEKNDGKVYSIKLLKQ